MDRREAMKAAGGLVAGAMLTNLPAEGSIIVGDKSLLEPVDGGCNMSDETTYDQKLEERTRAAHDYVYDNWTRIYEGDQLVKRWEGTRLLENIEGVNRRELAVLLENQRLFNESHAEIDPRMERVSIPIVRRVFNHAKSLHCFSWQAMLGPNQYSWVKGLDGEIVHPQVIQFSDPYLTFGNNVHLRTQHNLYLDGEQADALACRIARHIDASAFNAFANARRTITDHGSFKAMVEAAIRQIEQNVGHRPNWLFSGMLLNNSPKLKDIADYIKNLGITAFDACYADIDSNYSFSHMHILGYKGSGYDAAYNCHPYVLVDKNSRRRFSQGKFYSDFYLRKTGMIANPDYVRVLTRPIVVANSGFATELETDTRWTCSRLC